MALFRLPLQFSKKISFWKLLGCGKNGTFDIHPDWRQWGIFTVASNRFPVTDCRLSVSSSKSSVKEENANNDKLQATNYKLLYGSFINWWWKFFNCEIYTIILEPMESRGSWDDKNIFGDIFHHAEYDGLIAVLTRATIRLKKLKNFWQHVDAVASKTNTAKGFIMSVGIGELPWIKQGTFSVWQNTEHMKNFAYGMQEHLEVIRKTRDENWYSEEMFTRFKPVASYGSLNGNNPLAGKL
jgi:hypothetical protein